MFGALLMFGDNTGIFKTNHNCQPPEAKKPK